MEQNLDFETALKQLEDIVKKLESGECTLNESIKLFENGVELSKICNSLLTDAKLKLETLDSAEAANE